MSLAKLIFPVFTRFFIRSKEHAGENALSNLLHVVTATIKHEVSALILKIAFGLVATGILIYSLIVIGQHVNSYMQIYENGPLFSILIFGLSSVICIVTLLKLFKDKNPPPHISDSLFSEDKTGHLPEKIFKSFFEGLASGLDEPKNNEVEAETKDESKNIDPADYKYSDFIH